MDTIPEHHPDETTSLTSGTQRRITGRYNKGTYNIKALAASAVLFIAVVCTSAIYNNSHYSLLDETDEIEGGFPLFGKGHEKRHKHHKHHKHHKKHKKHKHDKNKQDKKHHKPKPKDSTTTADNNNATAVVSDVIEPDADGKEKSEQGESAIDGRCGPTDTGDNTISTNDNNSDNDGGAVVTDEANMLKHKQHDKKEKKHKHEKHKHVHKHEKHKSEDHKHHKSKHDKDHHDPSHHKCDGQDDNNISISTENSNSTAVVSDTIAPDANDTESGDDGAVIDGSSTSAQSRDHSASSDDNSSNNDPGLVVTGGASTNSDGGTKNGSAEVEDDSSDSTASPATDTYNGVQNISGSSKEGANGSSSHDESSTSGSSKEGASGSSSHDESSTSGSGDTSTSDSSDEKSSSSNSSEGASGSSSSTSGSGDTSTSDSSDVKSSSSDSSDESPAINAANFTDIAL